MQVGFDAVVSASDGDSGPLKDESPRGQSAAGPARRSMDAFGWKYTAPWGYTLLERLAKGRGFSLRVSSSGCVLLWLSIF